MKIGLVIYGSLDTLSGGYLYDRRLVEYLRAQDETVQIISLPWRNYLAHLTDNLHFRLPPNLDILIQDELNHPSLIGANRAPRSYPVISLVHHLRSSEQHPIWQNICYRMFEKRYLQSVDGFIFNSQTTRDVVQGLLGSQTPHVVAYPPTDRFSEAITEDEIMMRANETGPLRILFLGNLIQRKGLHTLLEALSQRPSAFSLAVIGSLTTDPRYARSIQQKASISGLASSVTFHGSLDNKELIDALKTAHVLVVPSSYEGFGIVYLEGMSYGLPAIGTTAGAASEIINDGETGYLIPPGDSETLAERLSDLANDRSLLSRMSTHALHRFHRQPTWNETAAKIREYLYSMAKGPSQSP